MTDLEKIAAQCQSLAQAYAEKPGYAEDAHAVIALYLHVGELAAAVERRLLSVDNAIGRISPIQPCG